MELLLKHIIIGAAHDDSTRNYPPRCHPGTRVEILQRLTSWCYNINRVKCLLWLCGPAGVGKSAIIQSFAESVGKLVASVFISRPNKRNDPNRIFTTIAYQLAVNINSYRTYIVDRIATDSCILNKNMHVQFQTFIVEPFVEARISTGGKPVAILLDGLDEVEGVDTQRDIIRLISKFTQQHPDSSLTWIISSRPESHIKSTFNETTIQDQIELEFIPIDSTEACADVERFFRDSFLSIRHEFPDTTLTNWPEETALAKLAVAASGLFIFAETVVRFMRDPDYANPISRLKLVLSVIDRCRNVSIQEQPFIFLDNLYTEIMSNIPSGLLPTAKLLMRLALAFRNDTFLGLSSKSKSRTLRGMKLILQLDRFTVYAALSKFYSTLGIPSWQEAHQNTLTFLHASFADYLMDSRRSGEFSIDIEGVEEEVLLFYLNLWHVQFGETQVPNVSLVDERDDDRKIEAEYVEEFNTGIFEDMAGVLVNQMVERHKPHPEVSPALQEKRLECLNSFRLVNMISLCNSKYLDDNEQLISFDSRQTLYSFVETTFHAWQDFSHELAECGFLQQVSLKDINFDRHAKETYKVVQDERPRFLGVQHDWIYSTRKWSMESFYSYPDLPVLICGMVPNGRIAFFKASGDGIAYCIVPYRE